MSNKKSKAERFTSFYPTLIIKNYPLTSNCQSKMILLNNNYYQAAVCIFLFPKTDFTLQQIKSFEKSRVMVGKLTSAGLKLGLLKFRE